MNDNDKTAPPRQSGAKVIPFQRKGGRCPTCAAATVAAYRPFCSKRCADVDLGRWLKEGYQIPGEPAPRADEPED